MPILGPIASWRAGQTLPRALYVDAEIFSLDLRLLGGRWSCAGHVGDLAAPGEWLVTELGQRSAIVVRGADGVLRALANVCRHRGSRICLAGSGRSVVLTCPYHAWSYALDGGLRHARQMPQGFDPAAHGLAALPLREVGGLVFVSFGPDPPALDAAAPALAGMTGRYGWAEARVAARKTYAVRANWKLVMENYHECYHCAPAHPEFAALHMLAQPGARTIGAGDAQAWDDVADGQEVFRVMQSSLVPGRCSGSRDGGAIGPPMGTADDRGACVFAELGFLSAFLAYADYGVIYRFVPREVMLTEIEVIWLVRRDQQVATGELTWLWDVTSQADAAIIERNQAGVLDAAYRPGPYSLMEPATRQFVDRYVAELLKSVGGAACKAEPAAGSWSD